MTVMQMLSDIRQAGIIGMDGNGISADIKLTPKKGRKINTIIINGAESSPYLTVDHSLLLEKTDEILTGIRLIMKITGAHEAIIGIEANNTEALNALSGKLGGESSISLGVLGNKYPQGMERLLIKSLFNKEIPSTHSPDDIGVIIENVTTVYAVYEAIIYKKPLIERCITYTGDDVENRGNYKIRIGTPISLITGEFGLPVKPGRIIASDAMTGYDVTGNDMPVTKGTAGIIILPKKREYRVRNMSCIRCSRCLFACPMKLNPSELLWLCGEELIDEALSAGLNECIECGCCSYSCPSTIPIAAVIRYGKNKVEGKGGNI
jgi:electron transport complex protein RnfC